VALPGRRAFDQLRRQLEHGNFDDLAFSVSRVTRALTSGAYRRRHIPLDRDSSDGDEHDDEALLSPEARALSKPYFEVLIVDNVNEHQERWLTHTVWRVRRTEDGFMCESVVVPSLEDALIAILFNYNIQAVVVRPGLVLKSKMDNPLLARYLNGIGGQEDIDEVVPEDYGPELCRLIAKVRPELDAYLVTERSVEDIAGLDLGICRRVFYNQEDFMELHLNILRGVQARNKTPFFTALVEYSKQPTGVFHAMPISRGKSISPQPLDSGHGGLLWPEYLSGGNLGHVGRARQPAGAARPDQGGAGTGQPGLRLETDVFRHQRHVDLQQDRGAGAGAAG